MYAKLTLSAIALLMACKMFAVQLTPEEALARMNTTKRQSKGVVSDKSSLQLTYTSTFKGNNTYYVFNKSNEDGYLILSADDCMPAVLGVVEGNSFDYDILPDNMKWWLSLYDVTISSYSAKGRKYASSTVKKDIKPLLGDIEWNQGHPYNMLCPEIEDNKVPTGCVATAMAQVMGMYQWPKRGYGKNEYYLSIVNDVDEEFNFDFASDFSKSTYNWDKMVPTYYGDETEEQNLAVAQLMYDCGVAVNMNYNPEGSGAFMGNAVNALVKNFCYDRNIRLEYRQFYDDDVWENMVYDNISKGMPLICSGQSTDINHAYVCDGYQSDGNLFHFNWGWGGSGDGYFLLTGNDPNRDEKDSYTTYEAIFNLKPADTPYVEGTEGEFPLIVYKAGYMATYDDETEANKRTDVITRDKEEKVEGSDFSLIYSGYVASDFSLIYSGYVAHQYDIGFKFKNESNEYIIPFMFQQRLLQPFTNVSYNIWPSTYENILKNGKYTLSYVYKDITAGNTEWKDAIYQPGVTKPEIEVVGEEPCCCVIEKPELLYNGKAVVGFNINRVQNVNELTLKMKVKVLAPQKDNKITVTLSGYKPDFFCEAKSLNLTNIAADAVQTVEAKFSIKDIPSDYWFSIDFYQEYKDECMYVPYSRNYPMWLSFVDDNSTGIETIPQAEEKASTETIYDIYGRKVSNMNRGGLYIKNGKKFLVK